MDLTLPENDFDGAWKESVEKYLQPLLELCFPQLAAAIDWSAGFAWMDKELQEIFRGDGVGGRQYVDKLVRVRLLDGGEQGILLHIEAQSQKDDPLPLRMYRYNHRLEDRYGLPVASLAILADGNRKWKPTTYEARIFGCGVRFDYLVCKVLEMDAGELERRAYGSERNPGAVIVLASLRVLESGRNLADREKWKWELTRRLYEAGFTREDITELYRLIGWFITLPETMELQFHQRLVAYEEEKKMAYVTFAERYGRQQGLEIGKLIGRICMCQRVLGQAPTPEDVLSNLSVDELESLVQQLEEDISKEK